MALSYLAGLGSPPKGGLRAGVAVPVGGLLAAGSRTFHEWPVEKNLQEERPCSATRIEAMHPEYDPLSAMGASRAQTSMNYAHLPFYNGLEFRRRPRTGTRTAQLTIGRP